MAESFVQVNEGTGKKLHTFARTIGANTVEDEIVTIGLPNLASYSVSRAVAASIATANDHLLQVMAGASLNVYITRIRLYQAALATTAAIAGLAVYRLTTAGTGGTALTPAPDDPADAASGASAIMTPGVKGTEGTLLWAGSAAYVQTVPAAGVTTTKIMDESFGLASDWTKCIRIGAGVSNGIALKNLTAIAAATAYVVFDLFEANF